MRIIALVLLSLASLSAAAQDLPGRVGRLAWIQGAVQAYQDPTLAWENASINTPITSQNSVWTEPGARAELRVGSTAIRLDEATQLDIARLDDNTFDAQLARGSVALRVRHHDYGEQFAIATPQGRFLISADGRYRIEALPGSDEARLTVFSGVAELDSADGSVRVDAGRTVRVFGGAAPSYVFERASVDAFDRWSLARDDRWIERRAPRYVSTNMTGYEDLDTYGNWVQEPDYGTLWYPRNVASDWVPYREGHWGWVRPWGWTWVDDAPWGYAPSHYGRWVYHRNRWGWDPGQWLDRPVWAPALVAWVGGSDWNVDDYAGHSGPAVGWYPLSPWERYQPWYSASPTYVNQINIIVQDRAPRWESNPEWRGWNRDRGATVVRRDEFIDRHPVAPALLPVGADALRRAPVVQPTAVLPTLNEIARRMPAAASGGAVTGAPVIGGTPAVGGAPAGQSMAPIPGSTAAMRGSPIARPDFARPLAAPAPTAAPPGLPAPISGQAANPAARTRVPETLQPQQRVAQPQQGQIANPAARARLPDSVPQQPQRDALQPLGQAANPAGRSRVPDSVQQQQQRAAQEQAARDQQQLQQREAQQRAARDAQQQQQQREAQQRAAQQQAAQEQLRREAQQRAAQQQAAQQQQQRREAQQRAAQQQAAQEQLRREAQQRAAHQQAAQQQRAREAQPQAPQEGAPPANPAARRDQRD